MNAPGWSVEIEPSLAGESLDFTLNPERTVALLDALSASSQPYVETCPVIISPRPFRSIESATHDLREQDGIVYAATDVLPLDRIDDDTPEEDIATMLITPHGVLVKSLLGIVQRRDQTYETRLHEQIVRERLPSSKEIAAFGSLALLTTLAIVRYAPNDLISSKNLSQTTMLFGVLLASFTAVYTIYRLRKEVSEKDIENAEAQFFVDALNATRELPRAIVPNKQET
jgi:hypothetical protein